MNVLIVAGIILTIVQILKLTFRISSRYIPIVSLGIMILIFVLSWIYTGYPKVPLEIILNNIQSVLISMGVWSGTKALIGK